MITKLEKSDYLIKQYSLVDNTWKGFISLDSILKCKEMYNY